MARFSVNTHRNDPYKNFKFRVRWAGQVIAGVAKISGLKRSVERVQVRDGGDVNAIKVVPGATNYAPIILERGLTHDKAFEEWANEISNVQGDAATSLRNYRKDIVIDILNLQGSVVLSYFVTAVGFQSMRLWLI